MPEQQPHPPSAFKSRPSTEQDLEAILEVHRQAFPDEEESQLVKHILDSGQEQVSLVTEAAGKIVGHILFSQVHIRDEEAPKESVDSLEGSGLAPLAVLPSFQKQGIGAQLIQKGLQACKEKGYGFAAVLGSPDYYGRFGFGPASAHQVRFTFEVPEKYCMLQELQPGTLTEARGILHYLPIFEAS